MFASKILSVLAFFPLFSIESVFSIEQCYVKCDSNNAKCDSRDDFECASNPKQAKFIYNFSNSHTQLLQGFLNDTKSRVKAEFVCKKLVWLTTNVINKTSTKFMFRGCAYKGSCYVPLRQANVIENCDECDSDLCNSSTIISAGFYSFIISTTIFFVLWK